VVREPIVVFVLVLTACTPNEPVELGTACSSRTKPEACAVGKLALCIDGKWQESQTCTGAKACYRQKGHGSGPAICDEPVVQAGNACGESREILCGPERRSKLACQAGRWQVAGTCPNLCTYTVNGLSCR
jgi:hypothetical protein